MDLYVKNRFRGAVYNRKILVIKKCLSHEVLYDKYYTEVIIWKKYPIGAK